MSKFKKNIIIFTIFGFMYVCIELLYRGHTHWSMAVLGGLCGLLIGSLNETSLKLPIVLQCILGSILITMLELFFGYIINIQLGLYVWDYSNMPYNFLGQICLPFSLAWLLLSYPCIRLDDYFRGRL